MYVSRTNLSKPLGYGRRKREAILSRIITTCLYLVWAWVLVWEIIPCTDDEKWTFMERRQKVDSDVNLK